MLFSEVLELTYHRIECELYNRVQHFIMMLAHLAPHVKYRLYLLRNNLKWNKYFFITGGDSSCIFALRMYFYNI